MSMNAMVTTPVRQSGLTALGHVSLNRRHERLFVEVQANCAGSIMWQHRKKAEAHDLLALAQISGRLIVHWLELRTDLRALLEMMVRVPCRPDPNGPLQVAVAARLGLIYREEALRLPQPGYSYIQVLAPGSVWHPNVSADAHQVLCLGTSLPAGMPVKEIILMTYGALTMKTVQMDPANAAGVMNPAAAEWWQRNSPMIPLSKEPFVRQPRTSV